MTKFSDSGGVDSLASIGHCPEHAEMQEEGQPRVRDHLREEVPTLGHQPMAPYEPMELRDEILPVKISEQVVSYPYFVMGNVIRELCRRRKQPEKT